MPPSYDEATMARLGEMNDTSGICGFVAGFYAMYDLNGDSRHKIINATKAYRVLAEIKTYLRMLDASGEVKLLNEIRDYTRSFGGKYSNFEIKTFLKEIQDAADANIDESALKNFDIAMPPNGVVDYIKRMWNFTATARKTSTVPSSGSAIVGVSRPGMNKKFYGGLAHWVYVRNRTWYSWGQTFSSLSDLNKKKNKKYEVTWVVSF